MQATESNGDSLSAGAIREQTERILASEGFSGSERLSRFLRFAVEAKLRGEGDQLKEYLVGREVFDRDDAYDPRMDPIVRVEARRLRSKLEEYYSGSGRLDPIRIRLPKGGYAPQVEALEAARTRLEPAPTRRWLAALAGVAVVSALSTVLVMRSGLSARRVAVLPANWLRWDGQGEARGEDSLVEQITMDLAEMHIAEVISWPSVQPYRTVRRSVREIGTALGASHVLVVSARSEGEELKVVVHLVNPRSDGKAWAAQYHRRARDAAEAGTDLARVIAEELRAYYGGAE